MQCNSRMTKKIFEKQIKETHARLLSCYATNTCVCLLPLMTYIKYVGAEFVTPKSNTSKPHKIIEVCNSFISKKLISRIKDSGFLSILVDGTTDSDARTNVFMRSNI